MYIAAIIALMVGAFLILIRALRGPTAYDRILAMNAMGTKTVILVALLGFASGRPDFLDLAIVYALVSFITTVAILKYIEAGRLD